MIIRGDVTVNDIVDCKWHGITFRYYIKYKDIDILSWDPDHHNDYIECRKLYNIWYINDIDIPFTDFLDKIYPIGN
jgi:hypothetical protein